MFLLKLARKQIYLGSLLEHKELFYNQNSCGECTLHCYDFIGRLEIANSKMNGLGSIWNPAGQLYAADTVHYGSKWRLDSIHDIPEAVTSHKTVCVPYIMYGNRKFDCVGGANKDTSCIYSTSFGRSHDLPKERFTAVSQQWCNPDVQCVYYVIVGVRIEILAKRNGF